MKIVRLFVIIGITLLVGGQYLFAQSKNEKKAQVESAVKAMIDEKHYVVDVNRAIPMSGRSVNLTSSYSLEVRGDSVISYLPYYGQAYSAPYGGGNGLRFEGVATDYSMTYKKKGEAQIKFKVRTDEDHYTFSVQIYPNGSSTISVVPVNKQSITFYGDVNTSGKK